MVDQKGLLKPIRQAKAQSYERNDKYAQNMCLRVINLMTNSCHLKDSSLTFVLLFHFFHFSSTHHFMLGSLFGLPFSNFSFCFFIAYSYFQQGEFKFFIFGTQFILPVLSLSLGQDIIIHILQGDPSWYLQPSVESDPWLRFRKNY